MILLKVAFGWDMLVPRREGIEKNAITPKQVVFFDTNFTNITQDQDDLPRIWKFGWEAFEDIHRYSSKMKCRYV